MVSVAKEGKNARITRQTVGGRSDSIHAATNVVGPYLQISPATVIQGVGIVTTNYLEVGGATNSKKFYRVQYTP